MLFYALKIVLSALLITLISEIAKRSTLFAALLASLPLVSLLAIVWLYWEGATQKRIMQLSQDIFWLVLPSLLFFAVLPWCLRHRLNFYLAMFIAILATALGYGLLMWCLARLGRF